jgi:uncharacterized protein YhfF
VWPRQRGLRTLGLGHPGPMRDRLNALVLTGEKKATAGLWHRDYVAESEPLDQAGEQEILLDSGGEPLATVEIVGVEVRRFIDVPLEFALAEGEGFESIEEWRSGHRDYWLGTGVDVQDDTPVVCVWFRVSAEQ